MRIINILIIEDESDEGKLGGKVTTTISENKKQPAEIYTESVKEALMKIIQRYI